MIKDANMMISKVKPIPIDKGGFARHHIQENHLFNYDCFHQFDQTCGVHNNTCVVDSNESVLSSYQHNISEMCLCIPVSEILQLDFLVGHESKNVQYNNIFSVGSQ